MAIVIIGGTPGSGKTTLARFLSTTVPRAVHIESDVFFRFVAHRLDPSLPAASEQNATVVRAYVAAALEYAAGGYEVFLDGVIGPWLLPLIGSLAPDARYVLLHAPLDVVLARARARGRTTQASATPDVVARMHEQFARAVTAFPGHVIDTDGKRVEDVADEYRARNALGAYALATR